VLLADLPDETEEVIGDRGYDSNRIRLSLAERNITACIPPKKNRTSKPPYNWHLYKKRHLIENMFAKLKDWRRVATRYDRGTHTVMSAIHIAASFIFYLKECVLSLEKMKWQCYVEGSCFQYLDVGRHEFCVTLKG
jgi:transposase